MAATEASLRPSDYTSAHIYADEVERLLLGGWMAVCRVDQLTAPGGRVAVTLAGRPIMATFDGTSIRVLANVCAHRGSRIVDDGIGVSSVLTCPYHRWSYRIDGSLIGAPLAGDMTLDDVCLPVLRHVVWEGFVLVNLSGDAADPDLDALSELIAPWTWSELVTVASRRFESAWNWKVMVENWIECYHHLGTHQHTVEPFQPARATSVVDSGSAPWTAMFVDSVDGAAGDADAWMPGVRDTVRAHQLCAWAAYPTLLAGSVARYAFWLQLIPISATRHDVVWHLLAHPAQLDRFDDAAAAEVMDSLAVIHAEDMRACAGVQEGLASGLIEAFRLAPLEATVAHFQRWVATHLCNARR